jgi:hypothetical protein
VAPFWQNEPNFDRPNIMVHVIFLAERTPAFARLVMGLTHSTMMAGDRVLAVAVSP